MNLFQKYGIKEVADVVFYSITAIGEEEFYTPVLFLDTLKVSTLEKTAEKVEAKGGKGNKKLISWNFGKEITLNLEDALFSPASMSMIWGGKLNSKLSDYTSAIVKCNIANKYGDLNYSTKAYPSPALTDNEWEIIFEQADKLGLAGVPIDSNSDEIKPLEYKYILSDNEEKNKYIKENRQLLVNKYFSRTRTEENYAENNVEGQGKDKDYKKLCFGEDSSKYFYKTTESRETLYIQPQFLKIKDKIKNISFPDYAALIANNNKDKNSWYWVYIPFIYGYKIGSYNSSTDTWTYKKTPSTDGLEGSELTDAINDMYDNSGVKKGDYDDETFIEVIYLKFRYKKLGTKIYIDNEVANKSFFRGKMDLSDQTIGGYDAGYRVIWKKYKQLVNDFAITYCKDIEVLLRACYSDDFENKFIFENQRSIQKAMPQNIIDYIILNLDSINKIGRIDTDFHDIEVIDRMEKCIVKNKEGLIISGAQQKQNLLRYYSNDRTSSYTIYYDAKTMLPIFNIKDNQIDDIENQNFKIKLGTSYYKWTRTVKYKESEDDAILGKTLVIDAETFPDTYKIVGETYIRNQKTGKDQRYQFTIHRANVSSDTSVTLEAEGDPTTFSMQIDVLTPPNDIMMELKQYDVEEDILEGGTRIIPQKSTYSYTPTTNVEPIKEVSEKNDEIY